MYFHLTIPYSMPSANIATRVLPGSDIFCVARSPITENIIKHTFTHFRMPPPHSDGAGVGGTTQRYESMIGILPLLLDLYLAMAVVDRVRKQTIFCRSLRFVFTDVVALPSSAVLVVGIERRLNWNKSEIYGTEMDARSGGIARWDRRKRIAATVWLNDSGFGAHEIKLYQLSP